MHTAVKIAPVYDGPVIHVLDASRAVTVCSSLLDAMLKSELMEDIDETYSELREEHYSGLEDRKFFSLAETRAKKPVIDWSSVRPTVPSVLGNKVLLDCDLASFIPYIDWTPFFDTWQLKGKYPNKKYPKIFQDETVGAEARRLFDEASLMLQDIIREKSIQARGVFGIYPANSDGDDVIVYTDETRSKVLHRFHSLRQQEEVPGQNTYLAMADFIAPVSSGVKDYIGAFAVSAGFGADALCAKYEAENDDYRKIMTQALADRLAEAFAEKLHRDVRVEHWGYSQGEDMDAAGLLQVKCVGCLIVPPRVRSSQPRSDTSASVLLRATQCSRTTLRRPPCGHCSARSRRAASSSRSLSPCQLSRCLPHVSTLPPHSSNFQASRRLRVRPLPRQRVRPLLFAGQDRGGPDLGLRCSQEHECCGCGALDGALFILQVVPACKEAQG